MAERKELLDEAIETVTQRGLTYGTPEDSFKTIAKLWTTYVNTAVGDGEIKAHDVAIMMILMKVARLMNTPGHRDSWVDIAGYAACGGEGAIKRPAQRFPIDLRDYGTAETRVGVPADASQAEIDREIAQTELRHAMERDRIQRLYGRPVIPDEIRLEDCATVSDPRTQSDNLHVKLQAAQNAPLGALMP